MGIEFPKRFAAAVKANAQAVALTSNPLFDIAGEQIAKLGLQNKLARASFANSFPGVGGLLSYGPDIFAEYHHAARFAVRIIRGARPQDLPVEQPPNIALASTWKRRGPRHKGARAFVGIRRRGNRIDEIAAMHGSGSGPSRPLPKFLPGSAHGGKADYP